MKSKIYTGINAVVISAFLHSCSVFSYKEKTPQYAVDLVCGMKVDVSEAFSWKYSGEKYYFDSYNCKQSFEMNPEKFINPNDTIPKK